MKYLYIILLFVSLSPLSASAQYVTLEDFIGTNIVNDVQTDTIISNGFSSSLYYTKNVLERNYDFELFNKQRKLRLLSNEVRILGYVSSVGFAIAGSMLFPDASLWILIPTEIVIGCGIIVGSNIWANHLRKKADAIQESLVSIMEINHNSHLYITHYSMKGNYNLGFGVGYKHIF